MRRFTLGPLLLIVVATLLVTACAAEDDLEPTAEAEPPDEVVEEPDEVEDDEAADPVDEAGEPAEPDEPEEAEATDEERWEIAAAATEFVPLPEEATVEFERAAEPGVYEGEFHPGMSFAEAVEFFDAVEEAPEWRRSERGVGGGDDERFGLWRFHGHDVEVYVEMRGHGDARTTDIDGSVRITADG